MKSTLPILIKNGVIVNENQSFKANLILANGLISKILKPNEIINESSFEVIDSEGRLIIPGCIDDQVHFREPGLVHKGTIGTESKAAAAGGITSFMEMPNTSPQATTQEILEDKYKIAAKDSVVNYSFYIGATNDNLDELLKTDSEKVCGIKIFMGSSTGNMLVDNLESLEHIFRESKLLIATHCEDEQTVQSNLQDAIKFYNDQIPFSEHANIRSEEACYLSSSIAVKLARKYGSRLHLLHLSTAKELDLLDDEPSEFGKKITAEVCVHHLWFSEEDYCNLSWRIKWNPSIKKKSDRDALIAALKTNKLDVVATDHAPHLISEKSNSYLKSASGGPLVQHSLLAMLELYHEDVLSLHTIVNKMCHNPAKIFGIKQRGFIREGYSADLVIVDLQKSTIVNKESLLYKCGWSPFEGYKFRSSIDKTFVNGNLVYSNGRIQSETPGQRLLFSR